MKSRKCIFVDEIPYSNNAIEESEDNFVLFAFINNKKTFIGSFPSEIIAKLVGGLLFANEWDFKYFDNNNIFKYENKFYTFKNYEDKKINFLGKFNRLEDASEELDNFEDENGYIIKKGKSFIVKKDRTIFGKFNSLPIAKFVRDKLKNNSWNINYFDNHNIFKYKKSYIILKLDDLHVRFFKYFKTKENARNALREFNEDIENLFKEMYIDLQENKYKFTVKDDSGKVYGKFSSLSSAKFVNDVLDKNNWNLEYLKNNYIKHLNKYHVFNFDDDEIISYFTVRSQAQAEEILNNGRANKKINFNDGCYFRRNQFIVEKDNEVLASLSSENNLLIVSNILNKYENDVSYLKNNIILYKNYYYVFVVQDNVVISFYRFLSKKEAQIMFEIIKKMTMDFVCDNIYMKDDFYYIIANNNILGSFKLLEHAEFVKEILKSVKWSIEFFKTNNIFENNKKFLVFKLINNKIEFFEEFDNYDEAFEKLNPDYQIYEKNNKFELIRITPDEKEISFGTFSSMKIAEILKDILRENDWNIEFLKNNNIFEINKTFFVFKSRNSNVSFLGSYTDYDDAKNSIENFQVYNENNTFIVCNDREVAGNFEDENIAILVKDVLNNNYPQYFEDNEIIINNGIFYGFLVKNNQINFICSGTDRDEILKNIDEKKSEVKGIQVENYYIENESEGFVLYNDLEKIGIFEEEQIANFAKSLLINNYPEYFLDNEIIFKNRLFYVFKIINNIIVFLGNYSNRNDALDALDMEVDITAEYKNIKFENNKYIVFRNNENLGIFDNPNEAIMINNILSEHNWNIKYFLDYNIFPDTDEGIIYVFKVEDNVIISLGTFKTIIEAKKALNKNS